MNEKKDRLFLYPWAPFDTACVALVLLTGGLVAFQAMQYNERLVFLNGEAVRIGKLRSVWDSSAHEGPALPSGNTRLQDWQHVARAVEALDARVLLLEQRKPLLVVPCHEPDEEEDEFPQKPLRELK